jgi:RNA-directed DNA polymerase
MNWNDERQPAIVAATPQQAGKAHDHWWWVERSVWTERMLTRLAQSERTTVWFRLWDKVMAPDNLQAAYWSVWRKRGAPGVDGQTVEQFDTQEQAQLEQLREELRRRRYRRQPARRVWIPKLGTPEQRPLGIPTVSS